MVMINHPFSLAAQPAIIFGEGSIGKLGRLARERAKKALLVTGITSWEQSGLGRRIEDIMRQTDLQWERFAFSGEPSPAIVDEAVKSFKDMDPDIVIAIGGGSVLDAGKAIAAMFCEEAGLKHYLEDVGDMKPSGRRLRLIAIPTTAGTGSETTKNAVISEFGRGAFKKSLRHDNYVPDIAIVDPELTYSCPAQQVCASGMDAFTQLLESFLSTKANEYTDALALSGLQAVGRSLYRVFSTPDQPAPRIDMSRAATLSGITLNNAGLGVIHGFAQPLGSLFPIPHGIVCGSLMGAVNRMTVQKLREGADSEDVLKKYALTGRFFTDKEGLPDTAYVDILLDKIDQYVDEFRMPRFSDYGVTKSDIAGIVSRVGMKNHPVDFTEADLGNILAERL